MLGFAMVFLPGVVIALAVAEWRIGRPGHRTEFWLTLPGVLVPPILVGCLYALLDRAQEPRLILATFWAGIATPAAAAFALASLLVAPAEMRRALLPLRIGVVVSCSVAVVGAFSSLFWGSVF